MTICPGQCQYCPRDELLCSVVLFTNICNKTMQCSTLAVSQLCGNLTQGRVTPTLRRSCYTPASRLSPATPATLATLRRVSYSQLLLCQTAVQGGEEGWLLCWLLLLLRLRCVHISWGQIKSRIKIWPYFVFISPYAHF